MIKLFDYYRSSAAYRVRIALNHKGLTYQQQPVHLLRNGGEQFSADYRALNPQSLIPALVDGDIVITQSMAIIEYLEETYPTPSLLPTTAADKAKVRSMVQLIVSDIHPLHNLRVTKYLANILNIVDEQKSAWIHHWIREGFAALELLVAKYSATGQYCFGSAPTLADVCLIPQMFSAKRFECPVTDFPKLMQIYEHCLTLPSFANAQPSHQPDAE